MKEIFPQNKLSAYEAIGEAQKIAFGPLIFQAARTLRDLGVLKALDDAGESGISVEEIAANLELSKYGVETLLESGLSAGIVTLRGEHSYLLTKIGYFLLHDEMTRINMDYNHYICYPGMYYLDEAIKSGSPSGLKTFGGNWQTLYEALPHLPEEIQQKWLDFDHFYSDSAYSDSLKEVFSSQPASLVDIGTNTGKFAILAAQYCSSVSLTLIDLPDQLENTERNFNLYNFVNQIDFLPMNLLDPQINLPKAKDVYWLSQFISCFSKDEILKILKSVVRAASPESRIFILENCWDKQKHRASAFSVINTSLYFTAIASGNSKMYNSRDILDIAEKSGLKIERMIDQLGLAHTLFVFRVC